MITKKQNKLPRKKANGVQIIDFYARYNMAKIKILMLEFLLRITRHINNLVSTGIERTNSDSRVTD